MSLARAGGGSFVKSGWKRYLPTINQIGDFVEEPAYQNRFYMLVLSSMASVFFVVPIVYNQAPKEIKGSLLLASSMSFAGFGYLAAASVEGEKLLSTAKNARRAILKKRMETDVASQLVAEDIKADDDVIQVIQSIPEERQSFYLQKYQKSPLVQPPAKPVEVVVEQPKQPTMVGANHQAMEAQYEIQMLKEFVSPDWITPDFIKGSKFIFAPKGSGKSSWLTYECVAFLENFPDGVLWICDIHYDPEESNWLPGIPIDALEEHFLFSTHDEILKRFRKMRQILRDRITRKSRKEAPVKIVCDEFDSFMRRIQEGERLEVAEIVQEIEDEGRKFGVFQTLVAHSGKKEQIYIDSTAIAQMHLMAMGNALSDPNTKLPADIDKSELLKDQQEAQQCVPDFPVRIGANGKPEQMARAIMLRRLNEPPEIVYVPHPAILLEECSLQWSGEVSANQEPIDVEPQPIAPTVADPMMALKEWFQACVATDGEEPSDSAIFQMFQTFTGRSWNQSQEASAKLRADLRG